MISAKALRERSDTGVAVTKEDQDVRFILSEIEGKLLKTLKDTHTITHSISKTTYGKAVCEKVVNELIREGYQVTTSSDRTLQCTYEFISISW